MKTVQKIKVTRSGNVHLLDNEGKVIIKLHSGDAFYPDNKGNIYVARKDTIEYLNGEIYFDRKLPVCEDGVDNDGWIELLGSRYVMVISRPAIMFLNNYEQYNVTANVIIAKLTAGVKYAFLHSRKEAKIIKEMYGDAFDSISPNRDKYLAFLKRVEDDRRIKELVDILERYDIITE